MLGELWNATKLWTGLKALTCSGEWRTPINVPFSKEFNSLLHELGVYSAAPEASACAAVWIWSSRQLLQMSSLSKLALEENKKIEHFRKINGLPSFRQKLRIMYEGTWCHLSLFTRHVLPPNQDLISRSWPAGYFITATRAAWCLWRYMPVGISYPSSLHWPYKASFMRYYPI